MLSIVITVTITCSALIVGVASAQFFPTPFGYGSYGYPAFDGLYGMPFGMPFGMPYGISDFGFPSYAGPQMPYGLPSYVAPEMQVPYTSPAYTGQQLPLGSEPVSTGVAGMLTIPGLEGLAGFVPGQNKLSLAVVPVTQQNNMLGFQVIGFAISGAYSNQAVVYSLSTPLPGVIDPTQNTLQIDLSGLASNINQAGYISIDQVYNTIRSGPQVIVIDVDMTYQAAQGTQTIFGVNSVSIIPPDGRMQAFTMQQPTQLIIDSQTMRIYMVAFPQMINTFVNYYGVAFPQVLPIVYAQPIPIVAPIFVPYLTPFPIFFSSFVSFNPFFFGSGFVSFFNKASFHGGFPIHDRDFGVRAFNQFAGARGISTVGGRIGPGGVGTRTIANIGGPGIGPSGIAGARAPGVSAISGAGTQAGIAGARAPGVSISSAAAPTTGFASVRAPGVSIGSGAGTPSFLTGLSTPSGFANVRTPGVSIGSAAGTPSFAGARAPGVSIGSGAGMPSFTAASAPSFSGLGRGVGMGAGMGAGLGGSGIRIGGGRR